MTQDQPPEDNMQWETPERRRLRRQEEETEEVGFPIVWVLIGGLAALLTIGLVALGLVRIFTKDSTTALTEPTVPLPTTVLPTAEATLTAQIVLSPTVPPTPFPTVAVATPTPMPPTPTPLPPTPEPVGLTQVTVGGYVRIVNTDGKGLSLRAGPGTNNDRLALAAADAVLPVIDGPRNDEGGETDETGALYQWWYLRNTDGAEGWGRGDFLEPAPPPQ
jgi:hypothetical protein